MTTTTIKDKLQAAREWATESEINDVDGFLTLVDVVEELAEKIDRGNEESAPEAPVFTVDEMNKKLDASMDLYEAFQGMPYSAEIKLVVEAFQKQYHKAPSSGWPEYTIAVWPVIGGLIRKRYERLLGENPGRPVEESRADLIKRLAPPGYEECSVEESRSQWEGNPYCIYRIRGKWYPPSRCPERAIDHSREDYIPLRRIPASEDDLPDCTATEHQPYSPAPIETEGVPDFDAATSAVASLGSAVGSLRYAAPEIHGLHMKEKFLPALDELIEAMRLRPRLRPEGVDAERLARFIHKEMQQRLPAIDSLENAVDTVRRALASQGEAPERKE